MSELRRAGDFVAPKDPASGEELRRQLKQFGNAVAEMGDRIKSLAMQRLKPSVEDEVRADGVTLLPGQFQWFDTTAGAISATLPKPTSADAGTFIVAIDYGNGASNLYLRAAAGCTVNLLDHITVLGYCSVVFCDGRNYWKVV